ncbi:MAG: hypothetical protein LBS64_01345 [Spirochaetaceae bacterium]|jgi:hypothetical protein|nr:hypothetical protein [Spirochaetaceae bacterium]
MRNAGILSPVFISARRSVGALLPGMGQYVPTKSNQLAPPPHTQYNQHKYIYPRDLPIFFSAPYWVLSLHKNHAYCAEKTIHIRENRRRLGAKMLRPGTKMLHPGTKVF